MATAPESKGLLTTLKRGQHYLKSWPQKEKGLAAVFPEHSIIKAVRFALRFMPPIAVFTLTWQISMGGSLGPAVATALFACSLPIQGLWWLGRRSATALPVSLVQWYEMISQQLNEAGHATAPINDTLTYQHLADLLQQAFRQIDKAFLEDL
jgi:uncharacterized membrane protein YfbV (UPF0208 family)